MTLKVIGHLRNCCDGWEGRDSTLIQAVAWARYFINELPLHSSNAQIVEIGWQEEEETMWWKVRGHPTAFVSCCMTRERVAAEMQARTSVGSSCFILTQEEGLGSDTKDNFGATLSLNYDN